MVLVDFLRLTPGVGSGITGTYAIGLVTLRPDFVRVGCGVYDSEASESSSSFCMLSDMLAWLYHDTHVALFFCAVGALPLAAATSSTTSAPPSSSSPPSA